MNTYRARIQIRVLEYEFYIEKFITANSWGNAMDVAKEYCRTYYGEGSLSDDEENISYVFNGGCPIVTLEILELMGKERWVSMILNNALIVGE